MKTIDVSSLALIAADLSDIGKDIAALATGGPAPDDAAAIEAAQESQLAADQQALTDAISPVQEALDTLRAGLKPAVTVAPQTLSVASEPLSLAQAPEPVADPTATSEGLAISPTSISGAVGSPLSIQFSVTGGVAPYSFSGSPPEGLSVSPTGMLTGTLARPYAGNFVLSLVDSDTPAALVQSVQVDLDIS